MSPGVMIYSDQFSPYRLHHHISTVLVVLLVVTVILYEAFIESVNVVGLRMVSVLFRFSKGFRTCL